MFKRWLLRAGKRPWKAKKEKFHTCGGPRRRPCLGQGRGRRIYAWCILHQVFSHPPCQNKATCPLADQSWDSEGYFTWPAWWIEFIGRFTLAFLWRLRIWVVVHDPNRNFLSRNFFGRSLRERALKSPRGKPFVLAVYEYTVYNCVYIYIYILYYVIITVAVFGNFDVDPAFVIISILIARIYSG